MSRNENDGRRLSSGQETSGGGGEALPGRVEGLGEDAGGADHGHEVVVAVPAGDDVPVEMRDAAAGDWAAEVEAEVESVGLKGGGEEAFAEGDLLKEIGAFGGGELLQVGDVAERDGEEVTGVVGKAVEDQVGQRAAVDDERGSVVAESGEIREGALHRGWVARRFNVVHAPVRMKLLHVRETKSGEGKRRAAGKSKPQEGGKRRSGRDGEHGGRAGARRGEIRACGVV